MTGTPNDQLLNQILSTLNSLGERLAVVESDLKTVIRDHTKDLDDHEARLRTLEADRAGAMTRADFEAHEAARVESDDRRQNRRLVWLGLMFAAAQVVEGAFLYWLSVK